MAYVPPPEPDQLGRDADGVLWRRSGSCVRCGECCKGSPFGANEEEPEGAVVGYCPLFRWASEGEGCCTDRSSAVYLRGCDVFPQHPGQVADKPSCSYSFERVEE